jgi:hypothetical protein
VEILPTGRGDNTLLPEAKLLLPALFGTDAASKRRLRTLNSIAGAKEHSVACERLAEGMSGQGDGRIVAALPHFAALADSAMNAMQVAWQCLAATPKVSLSTVSKALSDAHSEAMAKSAERWQKRKGAFDLPQEAQPVTALADALTGARSERARLRILFEHHRDAGGGLRWFTLAGDHIHLAAPHREADASHYRFRLWPLCRLAAQTDPDFRNIPAGIAKDPGAAQYFSEEE